MTTACFPGFGPLTEIDARLKTLIAFGADIFIVGDHESIRFWKNGSGFDAAGLDYLIKTRKEYYVRRQWERTLKKGDRVAVLGRGLAVVERADGQGGFGRVVEQARAEDSPQGHRLGSAEHALGGGGHGCPRNRELRAQRPLSSRSGSNA